MLPVSVLFMMLKIPELKMPYTVFLKILLVTKLTVPFRFVIPLPVLSDSVLLVIVSVPRFVMPPPSAFPCGSG